MESPNTIRTQENEMTTKEKVARRKLSLLELAQELDNVSRACRVMGYSRQQCYEIRRNFQTFGAAGLLDRLPGTRGPHPNRVSAEIEAAVLAQALEHPCHGALRVEQELRLRGLQVSAGGVRGVWQRHGLLTKHERLLRLEKATAEQKIALSDEQIRLLERFSPEFRERHIEAPHTGALVAVDPALRAALRARRRPQGRRADLPANRDRLPQPLRLGPAQHLEAADHRGAVDEQRRAADLRGGRRSYRGRPLRQRPGILRPPGSPPLRAVPAARGDRTPHHPGQATPVERHRRTTAPHAARRALPGRGAPHLV